MYQSHGLKGAQRIIYEDLCRLLARSEPVSISRLADESGYTEKTVQATLLDLRKQGLIEIRHAKRGARAEYCLKGDEMIDIKGLIRAMVNAITMSSDERSRRLAIAYVSKQVYNKGQVLKRLATRVVVADFKALASTYLDQNYILDTFRVWPLEEADQLLADINDWIGIAEALIEQQETLTPDNEDAKEGNRQKAQSLFAQLSPRRQSLVLNQLHILTEGGE